MAVNPNNFDTMKDTFKSFALVISAGLGLLSALSPIMKFIQWPEGYESAGSALSTGLGLISLLTIFVLVSPKGPNAWPFVGLAVCLGLTFVLVWMYLYNFSNTGISALQLLFTGILGNVSLTSCFAFIMAAIVQRARQDAVGAPNNPKTVLAKSQVPASKKGITELLRLVYFTQWEKIIETKTSGGYYWTLYRNIARSIVSNDLKVKEKALERATFLSRLLILLVSLVPPALNKNWEIHQLLNGMGNYLILVEKGGVALKKAIQKPGLTYTNMYELTMLLIEKCVLTTYHYGTDRLYQEIRIHVGNLILYRGCMSAFESSNLLMNATMRELVQLNPYLIYGQSGVTNEPLKKLKRLWEKAKNQIGKGQLEEVSDDFFVFGNEMVSLAEKLPEGLSARSEAILIMATAFTISAAFAFHLAKENPEKHSQAMKSLIHVLIKYVDQKYAARKLAGMNKV